MAVQVKRTEPPKALISDASKPMRNPPRVTQTNGTMTPAPYPYSLLLLRCRVALGAKTNEPLDENMYPSPTFPNALGKTSSAVVSLLNPGGADCSVFSSTSAWGTPNRAVRCKRSQK